MPLSSVRVASDAKTAARSAEAGARVVVGDISEEALEDARKLVLERVPNAQIDVCPFDLRSPESVLDAVERATYEWSAPLLGKPRSRFRSHSRVGLYT